MMMILLLSLSLSKLKTYHAQMHFTAKTLELEREEKF